MNQEQVPALYGYSRHVLPRPSDWSKNTHVTGYWYLDTDANWTPPPDLVTFLASGSAPVYIGFGSMGNKNPEEAGKIALDALRLSGQRGIIASGWGGMSQTDLPNTVYMLSSVPHSWLFPQLSAVVHHGGAGTTAAGLRAGIPSIIIPFMGDQPYWAHQVVKLGIGPNPIPRKKLTAENLAEAITRATSDTNMRQKAKTLGEKICSEDGIKNATLLIQQVSDSLMRR
jgi:UDP:flavonoid glycosyltransferase YjiC (YdhE family)